MPMDENQSSICVQPKMNQTHDIVMNPCCILQVQFRIAWIDAVYHHHQLRCEAVSSSPCCHLGQHDSNQTVHTLEFDSMRIFVVSSLKMGLKFCDDPVKLTFDPDLDRFTKSLVYFQLKGRCFA